MITNYLVINPMTTNCLVITGQLVIIVDMLHRSAKNHIIFATKLISDQEVGHYDHQLSNEYWCYS